MDKTQAIWKCKFNRRTKDKSNNTTIFCNLIIKGIKTLLENKFKFYLKEDHSDICYILNKDKFKE